MRIFYIAILFFCAFTIQAQINVLSGPPNEIYQQFAKDINNNTNIPFNVFVTKGSLHNLQLLQTDSFQLSFMQYDVLAYKEMEYKGLKDYIRVLLPLYYEEVQLIVRNNKEINSFNDIQGKRVAVGSDKSGAAITSKVLKLQTGYKWNDVILPFNQCLQALMHDSIDAILYVGASPSNFMLAFPENAQKFIKMVPIEHPALTEMYSKRIIEKSTYPWLTQDISTISTRSILVVNIKNVSGPMIQQIDMLYNDLKDNLRGIQKNKFSHPKWQQVEFTNMDKINWPVYKREYITVEMVFDLLAYVAMIMTIFQIYFVLNKLWSRKQEKMVAESISISAMFISISINGLFAFKNLTNSGVPQFTANILWIICSIVTTLIGIGFWVHASGKRNVFLLLKQALKQETKEAGDLAKAFFKPSSADKVITLLGEIAMIDDDLADEEKHFIQSFADAWDIPINFEEIKAKYGNKEGTGYQHLRVSMKEYLQTNPPQQQVSQLADVITLLVNIDNVVTKEEELMHAELMGLINRYLGQEDIEVFNAVIVPQHQEDIVKCTAECKELKRIEFAGGFAFVSEGYYSQKYAETICEKYRELGFFAISTNVNKLLKA